VKIYRENQNLVRVGQTCRLLYVKTSIEDLSSNEMVSGCYDNRGAVNVTGTRHSATLYGILHRVLCSFSSK
jgi:hypothetical protein